MGGAALFESQVKAVLVGVRESASFPAPWGDGGRNFAHPPTPEGSRTGEGFAAWGRFRMGAVSAKKAGIGVTGPILRVAFSAKRRYHSECRLSPGLDIGTAVSEHALPGTSASNLSEWHSRWVYLRLAPLGRPKDMEMSVALFCF